MDTGDAVDLQFVLSRALLPADLTDLWVYRLDLLFTRRIVTVNRYSRPCTVNRPSAGGPA